MKKVILMLSAVIFFSSCANEKIYSEMKFLLGTEVTITITSSTPAKAYAAFDAAFTEIQKVNDLMNTYSTGSDVFKINLNAGEKPVIVNDETSHVVKTSLEMSRLTDGAFDVTFAPLGELWDFKMDPFIPPSDKQIAIAKTFVDYNFIEVDGNKVFLKKSGTRIGLGGIAKGYSVQLAIDALKSKGIKNAVVNAGGDIKVIGSKNGKTWRSAIQHPREDKFIAVLPVNDGEAVVTSGDYERYATYKGERYHHIIDTSSGKPTKTFASVTVLMSDVEVADALATSFFVMGLERTKDFLAKRGDVSVVLIDLNLNIYASKALESRLEFTDDIDVVWF